MRFVDLRRKCQLAIHKLMNGDQFSIHGVTVNVPSQAGVELRYQLMRGRYENEEADAVAKYIPKGSNVIELGGSLGVMSKVIRSVIGAAGTHIVVEANPHLIPICSTNAVDQICAEKTKIIHAAVAYGVSEVNFQFGHNAHVGRVGDGFSGESHMVNTISLNALVDLLDQDAPYCLVCDIEGAEYDIFEKDAAVFLNMQYAVIEIHPHFFEDRGKSRAEFIDLLKQCHVRVIKDQGQILVLAGPNAP